MNDYFDRVEYGLRAALRAQRHLPWYRRLALRRSRALVVVLVSAVIAGPALAATGIFESGTPVGPDVPPIPTANIGVAIASSVQLLPVRVPDPGGGLPWGLRMVKTTRGIECLQVGRLDFGTIGDVGQDGAFGNDGRFHPLSTNFEFALSCATMDARGHAWVHDFILLRPSKRLTGLVGCGA